MTTDTILTALFSPKLLNGPNNIEGYITLGWKYFPGTNSVAYWANS